MIHVLFHSLMSPVSQLPPTPGSLVKGNQRFKGVLDDRCGDGGSSMTVIIQNTSNFK